MTQSPSANKALTGAFVMFCLLLVHLGQVKHSESGTNDQKQKQDENDKTPLLQTLHSANVTITEDILQSLPTWNQVSAMYGSEPVILGLDTCQDFQTKVEPVERYIGGAGMENTGTNLLHELLYDNCVIQERYDVYQSLVDEGRTKQIKGMKKFQRNGILPDVPWGKHKPLEKRGKAVNQMGYGRVDVDNILPVAIVKDPYFWMGSMCRHPYQLHWHHGKGHCPNLIPNQYDLEHKDWSEKLDPQKPVPVDIHSGSHRVAGESYNFKEVETFESLVHVWNHYYEQYFQASTFPRLIIRSEDLIFHAPKVIEKVCHCAGGTLKHNTIQQRVEPVKTGSWHTHTGAVNGLVGAMIQYGHEDNRFSNFTADDLQFARNSIDKTLFHGFGYKFPID